MNVGDKLPEILGLDQNGNQIKLADFAGKKLVLYTYPKDNTAGCSAEACSLKEHIGDLANQGYAVLGVSKDSAASHTKFIEKFDLPFPLIADTDTSLLQNLGAWGEKVACGRRTVGTLRTTFLADENGVIVKVFSSKEIKTKIHAEQILDYIKD